MVFFNIYNKVSWEKSFKNVLRIQKLLFRVVLISDTKKVLSLQKFILTSNSARLLAIRQVTQISLNKKLPGIDGKTSLTFNERFELNEYLKLHFNSWQPQLLKKVFFKQDGLIKSVKLSTISDRAWQSLVFYAIEPVHEAIFSPCSFGFRAVSSIHDIQRVIFFNLSKQSFCVQKRILIFDLSNVFNSLNVEFLINKIVAPRGVKLGIFRLLNFGFQPEFPLNIRSRDFDFLSSLFANILLDGIEDLHFSVRFGPKFLVFLKPMDNEFYIVKKFVSFLRFRGLSFNSMKIQLFSTSSGFDFLDWHFKLSNFGKVFCQPSFSSYQSFLRRVKYIINNSNYGSIIKANKLYPVIKDWKFYHRFCDMNSSRFSLFFIQKRAFKIFCHESRNDFYSAKNLIKKCFLLEKNIDKDQGISDFGNYPYRGHVYFLGSSNIKKFLDLNQFGKAYFCIHCGMRF